VALGALWTLRRAGISVPDQISIICLDDCQKVPTTLAVLGSTTILQAGRCPRQIKRPRCSTGLDNGQSTGHLLF